MDRRRSDWFEDTDPQAFEVYTQMHRDMSLDQKLNRIFELVEFSEGLVRDRILREHPKASDREVFLRVASTRLDRQSMIDAYGWDPDLHP
ncbi:MAG: hypothetical protein ABI823_04870 [Bryobacteraceae bacterium]